LGALYGSIANGDLFESERFRFFGSRGTLCREPMDSSAGTPTLQVDVAAPSPAPERQASTAFLKLLQASHGFLAWIGREGDLS